MRYDGGRSCSNGGVRSQQGLKIDSWLIDQDKRLKCQEAPAYLPPGTCSTDIDCPAGTSCIAGQCVDGGA